MSKLFCCLGDKVKSDDEDEMRRRERRASTARLDAFYRQEQARSLLIAGTALGQPHGTLLESVKLNEVYLMEVEHLGKTFDSEAPFGLVNHMGGTDYTNKILKDTQEKEQAPRNLRMSTFVADIPVQTYDLSDNRNHYNKLIGERECVLVDNHDFILC